jgi:hypothetical protein
LLLNATPLEDVTNANQRAGVMLRGCWYGHDELQSMLDDLADSCAPNLWERVLPLTLVALVLLRIWNK